MFGEATSTAEPLRRFASTQCPVTELPVTSRPEWTDIVIGEGYSVTFSFIGDRILHTIAKGDSANLDVDRLYRERDAALRQHLGGESWFVEIKDYGQVRGSPSRKVRAQAFERFVNDTHCAGFVGYGLRPLLRNVMRAGLAFAKKTYPFEFCSDYAHAVNRAVAMAALGESRADLAEDRLISRPEWCFDGEGMQGRYSVIPGRLVYLKLTGFLKSDRATAWLLATHRHLHQEGLLNGPHYYRIVDYRGAVGSKWSARWAYARGIRRLYDEYGPPVATVVVGANRTMRATLASVRAFLDVDFYFASEKAEAYAKIVGLEAKSAASGTAGQPRPGGLLARFRSRSKRRRVSAAQIDELVKTLGAIAWDTGKGSVRKVSSTHPLKALYDSIELVKQDVEYSVAAMTKSQEALRESEARLRRHRDHLEELVAERTADLQEANLELQRNHATICDALEREKQISMQLEVAIQEARNATQAKSAFLANMSHEIRTPMTAIMGFTENMLAPDLSPSDRIKAIHTVRRNGEHLLQLINDILDISKIEAGKLEVERIRCSPVQLVADVRDLMSVRAQQKGLPFDIAYEGEAPETIQSDPTRLKQILVNLIGNAIKFTDKGGVRLVTRLVGTEPSGRMGPSEPMLQFDIIDSGIGMTPEQLDRLFKPFTQADSSTTRKFGGTGLGLMISKHLAEMLGGSITIESKLGEGSRFRASVATGPLDGVRMLDDPTTATIVHPEKASATKPEADRLDCRILLAEDNATNRVLVTGLLKKAGAKVTAVENGQLAVDAALAGSSRSREDDSERPFDVILMDMQMPVMDGYEATNLLRQKGYTGPIIALTAHAMASDRQKCIDAGCDDYASKPIDRRAIIQTVRKLLPDHAASASVLANADAAR
ncbi:MAG: ATP-binding protein [Planctomycetota bacterium]